MSREEMQEGQRWVYGTLWSEAERSGIALQGAEWVETSAGFDQGFELLVIYVDGQSFRHKFREIDLEDCVATPDVRTRLLRDIRELLRDVKRDAVDA